MLAHIQKRRRIKSSFAILFTKIETMDIGHWKFEVWKGKQVYTRLFGLQPSGQGGHAIYLPKYKWKENVFFFFKSIY